MDVCDKYKDKMREWTYPERKAAPLSPTILKAFEKKHELSLPQEFKQFYLCFNGGLFNEQYMKADIPISPSSTTKIACISVNFFMALSIDLPESADRLLPGYYPGNPEGRGMEIDDPGAFGWSPEKEKKFLTFGVASSYDAYLLIGIVEENFGQIFLWHDEISEIANPHKIADSLFQFLDKIGSYDEVMG